MIYTNSKFTVTPENISLEEVVLKPYNVEEVNNNSVESRTDANTIGDSAEYDSLKGILYLRALLLLL